MRADTDICATQTRESAIRDLQHLRDLRERLDALFRHYHWGNEAAFEEIVRRHAPMVYAAALRQCLGDEHAARDIVQIVFSDLARKAGSLRHDIVLPGWLHRATVLAATQNKRASARRIVRERASMESQDHPRDEGDWNEIAPVVDQLLSSLAAKDRDALVLRFLQERSLREVAQFLGCGESGAQCRSAHAGVFPSAQWADTGLGSPLNSAMTWLWAMRTGHAEQYSRALGKTNILQFPIEWASAIKDIEQSTITEDGITTDGHRVVSVSHVLADGTTKNTRLTFRNEGGKWFVKSLGDTRSRLWQRGPLNRRTHLRDRWSYQVAQDGGASGRGVPDPIFAIT